MHNIRILKKRYLPDELIDLSSDKVIFLDDDMLVTGWVPIKPRNDIGKGISFTYLKKGYKISRVYDNDNNFIYWYCDIVDIKIDKATNTYLISDLLFDVKILANGTIYILDADEMAKMIDENKIEMKMVSKCLKSLDNLLKSIYSGTFPPEECKKFINTDQYQ
jgi:predicted RNA-binding protein associated with RNAse of E/G family